MRNADLALYDAKNAGKNRYAVFAPTMHEAALARLSLTSDLRHAIERGELVVYYQPLVDLASARDHRARGAGALGAPRPRHAAARPVHPARRGDRADRAARSPGAAHRTTRRRALAERDHETHSDLHIAVNVSGRQLQDPGIVDDIRLAIRASGIEPSTVVLEITESVLLPGDGVDRRAAERPRRARRTSLHRRLRHRLLVAVLPADASRRRPEAGPGVRRAAAGHRQRVRAGAHDQGPRRHARSLSGRR